jgi:hypothetical protein
MVLEFSTDKNTTLPPQFYSPKLLPMFVRRCFDVTSTHARGKRKNKKGEKNSYEVQLPLTSLTQVFICHRRLQRYTRESFNRSFSRRKMFDVHIDVHTDV